LLPHRVRKVVAWRGRLIDQLQSARLCRKQCEINRGALIRFRIFQNNVSMHNVCASRF
jgi:hypothetical protein